MNDAQKFIEKVRTIDLGAYWPNLDQFKALLDAAGTDSYTLMIDAMRLGFLKGQRAEHKKHVKHRPKQETDCEAYRRIVLMDIERYKEDYTFMRTMYLHSKALRHVLEQDRGKENETQ